MQRPGDYCYVDTELIMEQLHQAHFARHSLAAIINMWLSVTDRSEPTSNCTSAPRTSI